MNYGKILKFLSETTSEDRRTIKHHLAIAANLQHIKDKYPEYLLTVRESMGLGQSEWIAFMNGGYDYSLRDVAMIEQVLYECHLQEEKILQVHKPNNQ